MSKKIIIQQLKQTKLDPKQYDLWATIINNTEKKIKKDQQDRINVNGNILGNDCLRDGTVIHKSNKLCWYVFTVSNGTIKVRNLFDMLSIKTIKQLHKVAENFNAFAHDLKAMIMYQFWSRFEYEILITELNPCLEKAEIEALSKKLPEIKYRESINIPVSRKVDVYEQIMINWPQFLNYVWNWLKKSNKLEK